MAAISSELELQKYNVSVLTATGKNHQWFQVLEPAQSMNGGFDLESYSHLQHKQTWRTTMTVPAESFGKILEAHAVEGFRFPSCPLCPGSGWGNAKHLPAEMHFKAVYDRLRSSGLPFFQAREELWQEVCVVGGKIKFNHADGEILVQRIDEAEVFPEPATLAELDPTTEGTWLRICERVSVPIGPLHIRDEYPLLMCGRPWFQNRMRKSWAVLGRLLSKHGALMTAQCQFCSNRHEFVAEKLGGKGHFMALWELVGEAPIHFEGFWQAWQVSQGGNTIGFIRYNHLNGAVDVCRGTPSGCEQIEAGVPSNAEARPSAPPQIMSTAALSAPVVLGPDGPAFRKPPPPPFPPSGPQPPPLPTTAACISSPPVSCVQPSTNEFAANGGTPLVAFLWNLLARESSEKLSAALESEGVSTESLQCHACKRTMTEGFAQHIVSVGHMRNVEKTLAHGMVPPHATGEDGHRTQEFGPFWFNHLTAEWGRRVEQEAAPATNVEQIDEESVIEKYMHEGLLHSVQQDYSPPEEVGGYINLRTGDKVILLHQEGEWGYGQILVDGSVIDSNKGWFPLSNVIKIDFVIDV